MEGSYNTLEILFEDNHLIAVNKPAGLLTQADASGEPCLLEQVRAYLKKQYAKPGNVYVGLLHRLDRPVSGVVLFAKTSKAASRLSEQFREHSIAKTYHALVEGHPAPGALVHYLGQDAQTAVKVAPSPAPGLKRAELSYRVLTKGPKHSLVEVDLCTGRKHQIRAQLSYVGYPVVGDGKYGAKTSLPEKAIGLSSYRLEFSHPVRREERVKITLAREPKERWASWL